MRFGTPKSKIFLRARLRRARNSLGWSGSLQVCPRSVSVCWGRGAARSREGIRAIAIVGGAGAIAIVGGAGAIAMVIGPFLIIPRYRHCTGCGGN